MAITNVLLDELAAEYLELKKVVDLNSGRMSEIKATIKKNVKPGELVLPQAKIIYAEFQANVFNKKKFQSEHPNLHDMYVESQERSRLDIKA